MFVFEHYPWRVCFYACCYVSSWTCCLTDLFAWHGRSPAYHKFCVGWHM